MPAIFVSGDLFADRDLTALGHGCNCAGAMGKGIAVEFRKRYPEMYEEYKARCSDGRFKLGDVFAWSSADSARAPEGPHRPGITVFNLGTQRTWRTPAELPAIRTSVGGMLEIASRKQIPRIGLPRIGAGLGGLSWEAVKKLLVELGEQTEIELRVFEEWVAGASQK